MSGSNISVGGRSGGGSHTQVQPQQQGGGSQQISATQAQQMTGDLQKQQLDVQKQQQEIQIKVQRGEMSPSEGQGHIQALNQKQVDLQNQIAALQGAQAPTGAAAGGSSTGGSRPPGYSMEDTFEPGPPAKLPKTFLDNGGGGSKPGISAGNGSN